MIWKIYLGDILAMKNWFSKAKEYMPIGTMIVFAFTIISAVVFLLYLFIVPFADVFNQYISAPFRIVLSYITSIVPFSIAEIILITLPLWLGLLIFLACKAGRKGKKESVRFFCYLLSLLCIVFITYVWTNTSGFYNTKIEDKLGLDRNNLTKEELYQSTIIVIDNLNELSSKVEYSEDNSSIMPYSYSIMSSKICDAYDSFVEKHNILVNFRSRIKPIMLSKPMTYTHLSGVYVCMTGESNVNVNYPDFVIASTSAHEMAHQRGFAREDECNFLSFAVLHQSDDDFLKYSAYLDVFSYLIGDLRAADKALYDEAVARLDVKVKKDYNSYVAFFKEYADSPAADVTDKVNDSFLQANGQESGTKSYRLFTELACAYLLNRTK